MTPLFGKSNLPNGGSPYEAVPISLSDGAAGGILDIGSDAESGLGLEDGVLGFSSAI